MKFENCILKTLTEKLKLRRMRFKVDPAIANLEDFDGDTSYEGYILNENEGMMNILIIDPNNQVHQTMAVSKGIDILSDNLNEFKRNIIKTIMNKCPEQVLLQIQNAGTFDEIEQLAKTNGANDQDIKNAYRNFNTENTIREETLTRKATRKASELAKGVVKGTSGTVADIALGKDRQAGVKGLTGIFGLGSRIGSTLKKLGPQGKGDFQFKKDAEKEQTESIYHNDKPRNGEKFQINYEKDGVTHVITGTVSGEKGYGSEKYIQLKNANAEPAFEEFARISSVLVGFNINSPRANFYVYDGKNKMQNEFQANLQFDKKTNKWNVSNAGKVSKLEKQSDTKSSSSDYAEQTKEGEIVWKGKSYTAVGPEFKTTSGNSYVPVVLTDNPNQNPVNFNINRIKKS